MRPRQLLQRKCSRIWIARTVRAEALNEMHEVQHTLVLAAVADGDERRLRIGRMHHRFWWARESASSELSQGLSVE